ncbi:hypothetical protein [Spirosoma rhododendri]|uniref:hypothetical protein n=1 Tax=Spirosoma rhododendri TaxID=2728024 RepID=UPI0020C353E1|nr:hypothetical protein [Spirosoma rhododendri]
MSRLTHIAGVLAMLITLLPLRADAQTPTRTIDTTIFPAQTFYEIIRQNHPIIRQAGLFGEEARQVLMQARGAFDPKLVTHYDRKEFGNDLYYDHWQNKLAVPIWPGVST